MTMTRLCAVSQDLIYLCATPDHQELGVKFSAICQFANGEWSYETFPYAIASLSLFQAPGSPHRILHLLSEDRLVINFHSKDIETVLPRQAPIRKGHRLGLMFSLCQIGGKLYAVGGGGQNFERADNGTWAPLDANLFDTSDEEANRLTGELLANPNPKPEDFERYKRLMKEQDPQTLLGLGGTSETDIYACTNEAKILWCDGSRFEPVQAPTGRALLAVLAESPERIWVCGREGALLVGNHTAGFRTVRGVNGAPYFSTMTLFDNKLYLGSYARPRGLFMYDGRTVTRVSSGLTPDIDDVSMIEAVDGVLWVMGSKDLLRFDGEIWQRITFPGNGPVK